MKGKDTSEDNARLMCEYSRLDGTSWVVCHGGQHTPTEMQYSTVQYSTVPWTVRPSGATKRV